MPGEKSAQPDVVLTLDDAGVIREAALSNSVSDQGIAAWLGRPWVETLGPLGADDVQLVVEAVRAGGVSAFHALQRFPSGLELPMQYTTVRVGGQEGGLLAMGRSLQVVAELQSRLIAAQQATEQDYWKLRDVETRYRLLLDASAEAVLTIGAEDLRVVEANPAAERSLRVAPGEDMLDGLTTPERRAFLAMLQQVREHGRAPGILMRLGPRRDAWMVRATPVASEPDRRYLLHLAPAGAAAAPSPTPALSPALSIDALIDRLPDAFAAVNERGVVLRANRAFLDLVQVAALGAVVGESLGRWLLEPHCDGAALLASLRHNRSVRLLPMTLTGELGTPTQVEVSAAGNADSGPAYYGIMLRDVSRRASVADGRLATMLDAVTGQVGRTPLLQVVRETSDAVERHYIKAALRRVDGNRTAAAELLGLSRQSLHTKLNRYAAVAALDGDADPAG